MIQETCSYTKTKYRNIPIILLEKPKYLMPDFASNKEQGLGQR